MAAVLFLLQCLSTKEEEEEEEDDKEDNEEEWMAVRCKTDVLSPRL